LDLHALTALLELDNKKNRFFFPDRVKIDVQHCVDGSSFNAAAGSDPLSFLQPFDSFDIRFLSLIIMIISSNWTIRALVHACILVYLKF